MKFLSSFLTNRDNLGHPITVNYKGSDTYQTKLGGFFTIGIRAMMLIYLLITVIALVAMSDPNIVSYSRRLYKEEVDEMGTVYPAQDYYFNFGVYFQDQEGKSVKIPENIGGMVARTHSPAVGYEDQQKTVDA